MSDITSIIRRYIELLQIMYEIALEKQDDLNDQLNESHAWIMRADEILSHTDNPSRLPSESELTALQAALQEAKKERDAGGRHPRRRSVRSAENQVLERAARSGITEFNLNWNPNGSADALIQDIEITLTATLSKLLVLLADTEIGTISDAAPAIERDFCPFKAYADLSIRLEKHLGRPFSSKTIRNLISRLKNAFEEAGVNKYFIQTAPGGMARLALHRKAWPPRDQGS